MGVREKTNGVAGEYVWRSHSEVRKSVESYGRGLVSLGLERQKAIGVYSINRPEWVNNQFLLLFSRLKNIWFHIHHN